MLRLVLDRSREAALPPESMFLIDFESVRRQGELSDHERATTFLAAVWSHPKVKLWGLPPDPPQVPDGLSHEDAYRFCVEAPYRAYAALQGKERFGDKTPAYLHHVDRLLEVWPQARVVVLVRDGRDVALSILRVPFGPNNVWAAGRWWARGIRVGLDAERRHPGQVLSVRYEDVVADPATAARALCEFLGLTFDPAMLEIEKSDPAKIVKDQAGWFTGLAEGINASAVGKWRRELTPRQQRTFLAAAGPELAELGYELGDVGSVSATQAFLYGLHDAGRRALNVVKLRIVQERGRELGLVLRRKLAGV
jgi:hypothetical protein